MGLATLVRPQSILLAPILGALAAPPEARPRVRVVGALTVLLTALACCAPWTIRNCARMDRCALVSVNGGWNLLIGTETTTGGWTEMVPPPECRDVWSEAGKDLCFERAARRIIARDPLGWIARAPAKLAMTFDYFGAAPWYLHAANPLAFPADAKVRLGAFETLVCRLLLLLAIVTTAHLPSVGGGTWRRWGRWGVLAGGGLAAVTVHAWLGYAAIALGVVLVGGRGVVRLPIVVPWTAAVLLTTGLTHGVFFGAGRYGLVAAPFVAILACWACWASLPARLGRAQDRSLGARDTEGVDPDSGLVEQDTRRPEQDMSGREQDT